MPGKRRDRDDVTVTAGETSVMLLDDHLDVRNVAAVRASLTEALRRADGDVVLDLATLTSIDAAGLGMLTAVHLRCERVGFRLVLRNCPREIRRVLAVTRLNRILHLDRGHLQLTA